MTHTHHRLLLAALAGLRVHAAVAVSAAGFSQANSLQESEALVSLLRNPRTFAKVVDILGHNIYCYHAHLNVRSYHERPLPPIHY